MKLKSNQLQQHLQQHGLSPVFFLTGDEPLQMMECGDAIRQYARQNGFAERVILTVEQGFSWTSLSDEANNLSLFAQRRLIELRLSNKSLGTDGAKALQAYLQHPPTDTVLLITANKQDANKQKSKWFSALDKAGVIIQIWPIDAKRLPDWVSQRLRQQGLQANQEVAHFIAERSEGHLLACSQEIEKLKLLYGEGQLDLQQVIDAIADNARFEIFDWVDTILAGNVKRGVRQLNGLRSEGFEPILITWALDKEIRNLAHIAYALQNGQPAEQVLRKHRVWDSRKSLIKNAVKRHPVTKWYRFLKQTAKIDQIIKGMAAGNVWDELLKLAVQVAGVKQA
ncbi:DNA polymerase III subunit delta [Candidatus Albibeggiatoa sp. nov. NOAA]|uniref:DNA polymerase III subunit delta n=1 Tax=Candidatus Albibeggiatoa sp. nov. NOAA TaxID=3162724 RepID=UPI0032F204FE|nr:DNA polymerase III subunit delta [Thiotrichaceae bacterium]